MEAPGDDQLEWMAMQVDEPPLDEFDEPRVDLEEALSDGEEDELLDLLEDQNEGVQGKRKRLVFPDTALSTVKSQRARVEASANDGTSSSKEQDTVVDPDPVEEKFELEEAIAKLPRKRAADIPGNFIPITGPSGERVYAEIKDHAAPRVYSRQGPLLSESVDKIIERVEREHFEQICKQLAVKETIGRIEELNSADRLWVDKYAPKSFTELLSNEKVNREVLSWLKQWNSCVFGVQDARLKVSSKTRKGQLSEKHKNLGDSSADPPMALDRPEQKILLLCGPPGLGKTTLAHVAARHCGYRVVEINASDDRTAATFQDKIMDAVQMKPVMGEQKPNCLVIDEIDGALAGAEGKSAISFLIKLASTDSNELMGKEGERLQKSGKKRSIVRKLSRPVICICNDMYVPALRPLRQIARVFTFEPPSAHRVATRLKYICKMEDYKVDGRALTALAVHTESDIRSCLNSLQFLKKKGQTLRALDVSSQIIGRKDVTSSMFDIWRETLSKTKRKLGLVHGSNQEQLNFARLHELLENHGEHDMVIQGVHENFLRMQYRDTHLQKTVDCLHLILAADIFARRTVAQQQFFLNAYRPSFVLGIRRLIAQPTKPLLEWPKSFQRSRQQLTMNMEVLESWLSFMSPTISRRYASYACLVQDIMSPLLSILSPAIRPVASHLMSQQEIDVFKELVDTMLAYGVSYRQSKASKLSSEGDGGLHPPLYNFVSFKDYHHKHSRLPLTLQHLLNQETEVENIRRGRRGGTADVVSEVSKSHATSAEIKPPLKLKLPSAKHASSFFDRFKAASSVTDAKRENLKPKKEEHLLLYKFHQGFTNAVKKPVLMKDFLL